MQKCALKSCVIVLFLLQNEFIGYLLLSFSVLQTNMQMLKVWSLDNNTNVLLNVYSYFIFSTF